MLDKGSDADIAYGTGFASQSHLCTVFKKYMGISVGDYERIVRTKKMSWEFLIRVWPYLTFLFRENFREGMK